MAWKIVRKSNFDEEIFVEVFVEPLRFVAQSAAQEIADHLNDLLVSDNTQYIYAVESEEYKLYDGYEENF